MNNLTTKLTESKITENITRVNLEIFNLTDAEVPLSEIGGGSLTIPIKAQSVNVLRYSIPNAVPIFEFENNKYRFRLSYNGFTYTKYVDLIDMGTGADIYELSNLILMFNTCISECFAGLASLVTLPTTDVPYIYYDYSREHYKVVANVNYFKENASQWIKLWFNDSVNNILRTLPIKYDKTTYTSPLTDFRFTFNQNALNTSGNYITLEQESLTLQNYADPRQLIITTSLPIESELFPYTNGASGQLYSPILQSYIYSYSDGIQGYNQTLDWFSVTNNFRPITITSTDIVTIKCNAFYLTRRGIRKPFLLPSNSSVNILLEFRK